VFKTGILATLSAAGIVGAVVGALHGLRRF